MVDYSAWSAEASAYTEAGTLPPPVEGIPSFADRTHTVSASATGTGNGTDANPWTLQQAVTLAQPGMVIGVRPGVYVGTDPLPDEPLHDGNPRGGNNQRRFFGGFQITSGGTAEAPVYFVAQNLAALGNDPASYSWIRSGALFEGRGWGSISVNTSYVQLIGFYISDADCTDSNAGDDSGRIVIWGSGLHDISIRYCRFVTSTKHNDFQFAYPNGIGNNDSSIRLERAHRVHIADNYFEQQWVGYRNNQTHMTHYQAYYITIEHCYFKNGTNAVFQKRGFASGQAMLGIRFRFNIVERVSAAVYIAGVRDDGPPESERTYYYCNLFLQPHNETLKISTDNMTALCHDGIRWFNNTIIDQTSTSYGMLDMTSVSFAPLYGNTFSPNERINVWFNNASNWVANYAMLGYSNHGGELVDHAWWRYLMKSQNNVYERVDVVFKGKTEALVGTTWEDLVAAGGEADSVKGSPLMLGADYRPLPGSPCIGAGRDLFGVFGPVNGVVDAGCYPVPGIELGIRANG